MNAAAMSFGVGFFVGALFGICLIGGSVKEIEHTAIKHGCAQMVIVDTLSGKTEFQWRK